MEIGSKEDGTWRPKASFLDEAPSAILGWTGRLSCQMKQEHHQQLNGFP